jgi:predicted glycoside hydrolase/deacetylase ChbG (UPF0249 family)
MLIVNADDFGLSSSINRGIIEAIEKGAVNSVSLVANGKAVDEAVAYLRKNKEIRAGIHLTLIEEKPVCDPATIPSLVEDSNFVANYKEFVLRYLKKMIDPAEVRRELGAQVEKLKDSSIIITHCDSHQHVHLLPQISKIVVQICREYGIGRIRIVNEFPSLASPLRIIPLIAMRLMSDRIRKIACPVGVWSADRFYGFNTSMHVTQAIIDKARKSAQKLNVELMCHPGYNDGADPSYSHWNMDWDRERETLIRVLGK